MKIIEFISKLADIIFKIIKILLAVMIITMVIITTVEVVRRYVFGKSYLWAEELVKFLLVAVTFIGGPAAYRAGGLAFLDLITARLNQKVQDIITVFNNIVIVAACAWLAKLGFAYSFSPMVAKMFSTGLHLKMTYIYLTIPVGFVLMMFFAIEQILLTVTKKNNTNIKEAES